LISFSLSQGISVTGAAATTTAGTVVPLPAAAKTVTGAAAITSTGTVLPSVAAAPIGALVTTTAGSADLSRIITLIGTSAITTAGSVTTVTGGTATIAGAAVTTGSGVVVPENFRRIFSGVIALTSAGQITTTEAGTPVNVAVGGAGITTSAGNVLTFLSPPLPPPPSGDVDVFVSFDVMFSVIPASVQRSTQRTWTQGVITRFEVN
jgi:hypothetical protein